MTCGTPSHVPYNHTMCAAGRNPQAASSLVRTLPHGINHQNRDRRMRYCGTHSTEVHGAERFVHAVRFFPSVVPALAAVACGQMGGKQAHPRSNQQCCPSSVCVVPVSLGGVGLLPRCLSAHTASNMQPGASRCMPASSSPALRLAAEVADQPGAGFPALSKPQAHPYDTGINKLLPTAEVEDQGVPGLHVHGQPAEALEHVLQSMKGQ